MTRQQFAKLYRIARLVPRKWAALAAIKRLTPVEQAALGPALTAWGNRADGTAFVLQAARAVMRDGLSASKCIELRGRMVRHQRQRRISGELRCLLPA